MTARPLFSQGELRAYLHSRNVALHDAVQRTSDEHVLQTHPQEWASALAEAYTLQAPVLLYEERYADEPHSKKVDIRHEWQSQAIRDRSEPALVPGREVTVHVPFDGDATVLHLTASQFSFNRPEADVSGAALRFELEWPNDRPLHIGARVETELRLVDEYLSWARVDCEQHNRGLVQYAEAQIERRRTEIVASRAQLDKAGIPVRPAAGAAFAGWQDDARHDDDLRCWMHWPGDPQRLAQLALLFVHLPSSSRDT